VIVADTNVIAQLFFPGPNSKVVAELYLLDQEWLVPAFWITEFRNVATKFYRMNVVPMDAVHEATLKAEQMLESLDFNLSSKSIYKLIETTRCSAYDCEFVALAIDFDIRLLTYHKQILNTFPEIAIRPEDYLLLKKK
jgi:predicted nucleic acid-binding protein